MIFYYCFWGLFRQGGINNKNWVNISRMKCANKRSHFFSFFVQRELSKSYCVQWDLLRKDLPSNINVLLRLWVIFQQIKMNIKVNAAVCIISKHKETLLAWVKARIALDEVKEVETVAIGDRNQHHVISTVLKQRAREFLIAGVRCIEGRQ